MYHKLAIRKSIKSSCTAIQSISFRHFKATIGTSPDIKQIDIPFKPFQPLDEWLSSKPISAWIEQYKQTGFIIVPSIIDPDNLPIYQQMYDDFITNKINAKLHRHDLGSTEQRHNEKIENIMQIMWPTRYIANLHHGPFHSRAIAISKLLLGYDSGFDFDMMLYKAPQVPTATPWHQDTAYWPAMPDRRSASFWCSLDDADTQSGTMWYQPYGQERAQIEGKIFHHEPGASGTHVLKINDEEWAQEMNRKCDGIGIACPITAGSCTIHHGYTPHYAGGNNTDRPRRAMVVCCRPQAMVQYERDNAFDHGYHGLDNVKLSDDEVIVQ
eukprot:210762_1